MDKKTKIIISSVIVVIVLTLGIFFLLKNDETPGNPVLGFLPFGIGGDDAAPGPITPPNNPDVVTDSAMSQGNLPGLQKISDAPVSGSTIFSIGSTTLVRYIDRATGNIYEYNTNTKNRIRISNTTIPQIHKVEWGSNGNSFLLQSIQNGVTQNYFAKFATTSATTTDTQAIIGKYFDDSITSFVFSPKKDSAFYLSKTPAGIDGLLANKEGETPRKIWSFRTSEWLASWSTDNTLYLTTKAGGENPGFLYSLDTKTGAFTPIIGGFSGFTTLVGPGGDLLLYSKVQESKFLLYVYSIGQKKSSIVPFPTLPEKCAWSSVTRIICGVPREPLGTTAVDDWYKGLVSYNDFIQTITIGAEIVSSNSTADETELKDQNGQGMDVINPKISDDGSLLMFENKKDLSLWILPLNRE